MLNGPQMLVELTTKCEHTLRGAPEEVRRWTRVARCADPHGGKATWAKVRLENPGADRKPVELMALAAVVDETYTAYFRVVRAPLVQSSRRVVSKSKEIIPW